ncbi:MAG: OB-fold nucleic acid binding domain-containing protein, partial [Defluviitaleaceae bacterium]|nr:OB-fold nucleic acid binding domain-containing protein [Defluviitaleaceae bacterium]
MSENENIQDQQDLNEQLKIRRQKLVQLQESGKDPFAIVKYDTDAHSTDIINNFDKFEGEVVSVAGRMMSRRIMGKASFCHIQDDKGQIQIYIKRDDIGEEEYDEFKKWDIGDIIGISGTVFRTQKNETSVKSQKMILLTK